MSFTFATVDVMLYHERAYNIYLYKWNLLTIYICHFYSLDVVQDFRSW